MRVILTTDKKNSLSFLGKRQSSDIEVYRYIASHFQPLCMNAYAQAGMTKSLGEEIAVQEDAQDMFLEGDFDMALLDNASGLVVFNWNRDYPHDRVLDLSGWKKISEEKFKGHSHDKVTVTEYVR